MASLLERIRKGTPERYYANDLTKEINDEGYRRIAAARSALDVPIDKRLRQAYERDQFSRLPGVQLDVTLFGSIARKSAAALDDPRVSPCAFLHGNQADRQDIPREVITRDVRRYTGDVPAVIPEVARLLNQDVVHAIRSCIGSHFQIEDVHLTRNYSVDPGINARYEMLSDRWHFDHQSPEGFSLFICVSEVTTEDGPFHVIAAPESRRLLAMGFDPAIRTVSPTGGLPASIFEHQPTLARLTGPPATMLLCHTSYCLHRAGLPAPGHIRDMLVFSFRPSPRMNLIWPR